MSDLVERLNEKLKLKYIGNCKCGKCQLVEADLIAEAVSDLTRLRSEVERRDLQLEVASKAALKLSDEVERLTRERDEAYGYASRFLTSFVAQHCNPVPGWAPLHDLIGVLTQIDNASTVAREYRSELATLTARTREVLAPFAELVPAAFADVWKGNEQVVLRTHLQGDVAALRINDFRAANTLFNELKEKDNG